LEEWPGTVLLSEAAEPAHGRVQALDVRIAQVDQTDVAQT
jgi:hypothetical protein